MLTVLPFWLALLCALPTADESFKPDLHDVSLEEFERAVQRAPEAKMRLQQFRIRRWRRGYRVDASFVANPKFVDWHLHLNLSTEEYRATDRKYRAQGYVLAHQCALRSGRRRRSGLWVRQPAVAVPLKLPDGDLPVRGARSVDAAALDDVICDFLREHNAAGVTIAVARDGRLLFERGFGYADVDAEKAMQPTAEMRIASLSKPITAVAILKLQEQGKLKLSDTAWSYLKQGQPQLADPTDKRVQRITIRQLLQHTGGFDREVSSDPMFGIPAVTQKYNLTQPAHIPDIIRHQLTLPLDFDPGQRYAYSNFGYCLLGRIIESVSGVTYEQFIRYQILQPCAMHQTRLGRTRAQHQGEREARYHMQQQTAHSPFWAAATLSQTDRNTASTDAESIAEVADPYGRWDLEVMDAHGGWVSTAGDLARFASSLDDGSDRLLSEASLQQLVQRPELNDDKQKSVWYGCGWSVRRTAREDAPEKEPLDSHNIWHTGALDGTSALLVRRHDGLAWAVLFNTDRSINGKRLSGLIDSKMHTLANRVRDAATP